MVKNRIYQLSAIFVIVFLAIACVNVKAHAPQDMTLEYNSNTNTLTVSITHAVGDNTTHYVFAVVINVNGSLYDSYSYDNQTDLVYFVYSYSVITNNGSVIQVTASCNQGGSIRKTLGGTSEPAAEISGFLGLNIVLSISVITLIILIQKKQKRKITKT